MLNPKPYKFKTAVQAKAAEEVAARQALQANEGGSNETQEKGSARDSACALTALVSDARHAPWRSLCGAMGQHAIVPTLLSEARYTAGLLVLCACEAGI